MRRQNNTATSVLLVIAICIGVALIVMGAVMAFSGGETPEVSDGSVVYTEPPTTTTTATTAVSTTVTTQSTASPTTVVTTNKTGKPNSTTSKVTAPTADANANAYVQGEAPSWNLLLVNPWNPITDEYINSVNLVKYATNKEIDARVLESLQQMIRDGKAYKLSAASLYRPVSLQITLYERKVKYYKDRGYKQAEAERLAATVVARPYTSEHHTGMAVDILGSGYSSLEESFEKTPAFKWLKEHCAEYGFILRYPKEKEDITGVIYEPWHYRYVGVEAATEIMSRGLTLEEYLAEKY